MRELEALAARSPSAAEALESPPVNLCDLDSAVVEQIEIQARYEGYIARQDEQITRQGALESTPLPDTFDYQAVPGLSHEVRQKLSATRPQTLGQASRISGVTPAAMSLVLVQLKRMRALRNAA